SGRCRRRHGGGGGGGRLGRLVGGQCGGGARVRVLPGHDRVDAADRGVAGAVFVRRGAGRLRREGRITDGGGGAVARHRPTASAVARAVDRGSGARLGGGGGGRVLPYPDPHRHPRSDAFHPRRGRTPAWSGG